MPGGITGTDAGALGHLILDAATERSSMSGENVEYDRALVELLDDLLPFGRHLIAGRILSARSPLHEEYR